jgi:REP element-mobilizing transposase RayT
VWQEEGTCTAAFQAAQRWFALAIQIKPQRLQWRSVLPPGRRRYKSLPSKCPNFPRKSNRQNQLKWGRKYVTGNVSEAGKAFEDERDRGYLPHWERLGALYFVTFRLADSLPQHVLASYESERQALLAKAQAATPSISSEEKQRLDRLFSKRVQTYLDSGVGACHLAKPAIAKMVAQALHHFNGNRYRLWAWCIMPNHVHVVLEPIPPYTLAPILHSWKSFTANQAHKLLGTQGPFWQREYYDHLIRDETALWRLIDYVMQNPIKSHLINWPWVEVSLPSSPDSQKEART